MSGGPTGCGRDCHPQSVSLGRSDVVITLNTDTAGRYRPDVRRRWFGIASTGGVAGMLGIAFLIATSSARYVEPASSASLATFDVDTPDRQPAPHPSWKPAQSPARPPLERSAQELTPVRPIPTATTSPTITVVQQQPLPHAPPLQVSAPPSTPPDRQPQPEAEGPDTWEGRVLTTLIANRRYPRAALLRRYQGTPIIRLVMDRNGVVQSVRLEKSSRIPDLDREALALPKRAQPLPKPPESKEGTSFEFVVPIEFSLSS